MKILILAESGINFLRSDPSNHSWCLLGASWVLPGLFLVASGGLHGASWVSLGLSWMSLGCLWVPPGYFLAHLKLFRVLRWGHF